MRKKRVCVLLAMVLVMSVALVGCRKKKEEVVNEQTVEVSQSVSSEKENGKVVAGVDKPVKEEVKETPSPTLKPTKEPQVAKTTEPTVKPILKSTKAPEVTKTAEPTAKPTLAPTKAPETTKAPAATAKPTVKPAVKPTATPKPEVTKAPEAVKTPAPTVAPTVAPTAAPHTHSYDGGVVTTAASCSAEGVKTFTCSCGATKTESIAKTDHTWDERNDQDPGCDYIGYRYRYCTVCGASGGGWELEPLGHDPESYLIVGGTCSEPAVYGNTCRRCGWDCGKTYGSTDPSVHDWNTYTGEVWNEETWKWETVTETRCHGCGATQ